MLQPIHKQAKLSPFFILNPKKAEICQKKSKIGQKIIGKI
jgi:hypothetical protein